METIILFAPLVGALLAGLTWRVITDAGAQWAATGFAVFAAALSWVLWINFDGNVRDVFVLDWIRSGTLDAALSIRIDAISMEMMVIVTTLSAFAHLYALGFMERDKAFDEGRSFRPRFFAYLSLFTFGMLILVTAGNLLQLLLGLQVSGVMAYLLISFRLHYKSANAAAIKSFVIGALGHGALILGVAGLYTLVDSVALEDVIAGLPDLVEARGALGLPVLEICAGLVLLGAMAASAQVVLHVWLPDAMEANAPAAGLLSALFALCGAFVIWRLAPLFDAAPFVSQIVVWVGVATALLTGVLAAAQTEIKRIMGYVASAQIGVIFATLGLGLGYGAQDIASVQIPLFAVLQMMLVLCVGAITRSMDDSRDITGFGGLRQKLPSVAMMMSIAALVATGFGVTQSGAGVFVPETGNVLFGKAFLSSQLVFWALSVAAAIGVFAVWRVVFLSFNGPSRAPEDVYDAVHPSPMVMVFTISLLTVLMLGFVVWEMSRLSAIPGLAAPAWVSIIPFAASVAGFAAALWAYILQPDLPKRLLSSRRGLHDALKNGFYFDWFYETALIAPLKGVGASLTEKGDINVLDRPFEALSAKLIQGYSEVVDRRYGALLMCCCFVVFFGLVAALTWTVLSRGGV